MRPSLCAYVRDHWRSYGLVILALCVAATLALLLREIDRNEAQDEVDRDRTVQVEGILHDLRELVARQDSDRVQSSRESCERGNDIRRSVHNLAVTLAGDDPEVLAAVDEEFALVDCSTVVPPATTGG